MALISSDNPPSTSGGFGGLYFDPMSVEISDEQHEGATNAVRGSEHDILSKI